MFSDYAICATNLLFQGKGGFFVFFLGGGGGEITSHGATNVGVSRGIIYVLTIAVT
jgi:hypothetical protein